MPAGKKPRKSEGPRSSGKKSTVKETEFAVVDEQELRDARTKLPEDHVRERAALMAKYRTDYDSWHFQLKNDFSLIFYGFGSKKILLADFATTSLVDGAAVEVHGYLPSVDLKQTISLVILLLWEFVKVLVIGLKRGITAEQWTSSQSFDDMILWLRQLVFCDDAFVYLVVHNIEGPGLRTSELQSQLAELASLKCIRLLATIDNVNAPLLWDKHMAHVQFNWWWHHVPTYTVSLEETKFLPPVLVAQGAERTARSAVVVLRSLTPNARGVFHILAEFQLAYPDESGLTFTRWYTLCREKFLVSSELTLRSHLTEFKDHELVKPKRGPDGQDFYHIPLPNEHLLQLLTDLGAE